MDAFKSVAKNALANMLRHSILHKCSAGLHFPSPLLLSASKQGVLETGASAGGGEKGLLKNSDSQPHKREDQKFPRARFSPGICIFYKLFTIILGLGTVVHTYNPSSSVG